MHSSTYPRDSRVGRGDPIFSGKRIESSLDNEGLIREEYVLLVVGRDRVWGNSCPPARCFWIILAQ